MSVATRRNYLKIPIVEFVAVFEQELIGGSKTGLYAILNDCARPRRTR